MILRLLWNSGMIWKVKETNKKVKVLIVFDDMIAVCLLIKKT